VTLRQWSWMPPSADLRERRDVKRFCRLPAGARQLQAGIDDQRIKSGLARVTWQVSPRHKFAAYWDEIDKFRGHAMTAGDDYDTASVVWNSPAVPHGVGQVDVHDEREIAHRSRVFEQHGRLHQRVSTRARETTRQRRLVRRRVAPRSRSDLDHTHA